MTSKSASQISFMNAEFNDQCALTASRSRGKSTLFRGKSDLPKSFALLLLKAFALLKMLCLWQNSTMLEVSFSLSTKRIPSLAPRLISYRVVQDKPFTRSPVDSSRNSVENGSELMTNLRG